MHRKQQTINNNHSEKSNFNFYGRACFGADSPKYGLLKNDLNIWQNCKSGKHPSETYTKSILYAVLTEKMAFYSKIFVSLCVDRV